MPGLDSYRLDQYRIDGGGGSGNAQPGDVLAGLTFTNDDGEKIGTRPPGKKYASGAVTSTSTSEKKSFQFAGSTQYNNTYYFVVNGIGFIPTHIDIYKYDDGITRDTTYDVDYQKSYDPLGKIVCGINRYRLGAAAYVNASGFVLPADIPDTLYRWQAFGD